MSSGEIFSPQIVNYVLFLIFFKSLCLINYSKEMFDFVHVDLLDV